MVVVASCARRQPQATCCICIEHITARSVTCSSSTHHLCSDCLTGYAVAETTSNRQRIAANNGKLRCPGIGCSNIFEHQELAQILPAKAFDALLTCMKQAAAQAAVQVAAEQAKQERAREAAQDAASRARSHIINGILTLKCPRCDKAFDQFEGCLALHCSDTAGHGCGTAFCGFCLKVNSGILSNHAHVAACRYRNTVSGFVFGTQEDFQAAQRSRRTHMVQEYLQTLPLELRERVQRATAQDLKNLGIDLLDKQQQQQQQQQHALGQHTAQHPPGERSQLLPYQSHVSIVATVEPVSQALCVLSAIGAVVLTVKFVASRTGRLR
jgi:hypothetical protein